MAEQPDKLNLAITSDTLYDNQLYYHKFLKYMNYIYISFMIIFMIIILTPMFISIGLVVNMIFVPAVIVYFSCIHALEIYEDLS